MGLRQSKLILLSFLLNAPLFAQFSGGSGTSGDPYLVSTHHDLDNVRHYSTAHFLQTQDIDLGGDDPAGPYWNDGVGWEPLAGGLFSMDPLPFSGVYDGGGHRITGLYINQNNVMEIGESSGLFGGIWGGTVRRLGLENARVSQKGATAPTGILSGFVWDSVIDQVYVTGANYISEEKASSCVFIGYAADSSISNCFMLLDSYFSVGLLVYNDGQVINCHSSVNNKNPFGYVGPAEGLSSTGTFFTDYSVISLDNQYGQRVNVEGMKDLSTFTSAGWDFDDIWEKDEASFPFLKNVFISEPPVLQIPITQGSGTEGDPYLIGNPAQLDAIRNYPDMTWFRQTADIDLDGFEPDYYKFDTARGWLPVGEGTAVHLNYDGNGHTIRNGFFNTLATQSDDYSNDVAGLIGRVTGNSVIRNLTLENFHGNGRHSIGALVGESTGTLTLDNITLNNIQITTEGESMRTGGMAGHISKGNISNISGSGIEVNAKDDAGGLIGLIEGSDEPVSHISLDGVKVSGVSPGQDHSVGGVIGRVVDVELSNIHVTGLELNFTGQNGGGIVGKIGPAVIKNSSAEGVITGGHFAAGIAGYANNGVTFEKLSFNGKIFGITYSGGIVGFAFGTPRVVADSYVDAEIHGGSGLVGVSYSGLLEIFRSYTVGQARHSGLTFSEIQSIHRIYDSYSNMSLVGHTLSTKGGLSNRARPSGSYYSGDLRNHPTARPLIGDSDFSFLEVPLPSFWNAEYVVGENNDLGTGLTTAQMLQKSSYSGWDFDGLWDIYEGVTFPFLPQTGPHRQAVLFADGEKGWRTISTPLQNVTFAELLKDIWTQGFVGATSESGASNVRWYNGTDFESITSINDTLEAGKGYIVYLFDDNTGDGIHDPFPRILMGVGVEFDDLVEPSMQESPLAWTLTGNPYPVPLLWSDITGASQNIQGAVYVYDTDSKEYLSWNGVAGSLTNGIIPPFSAFWVQNTSEGDPVLGIPRPAGSAGKQLADQHLEKPFFLEIKAASDSLSGSSWLTFTESGRLGFDEHDAHKLTPLEVHSRILVATEADGVMLDINNLPAFHGEPFEIPLHVELLGAGSAGWESLPGEVSISAAATGGAHSGWEITLTDDATGNSIDLLGGESMTVQLTPTAGKKMKMQENLHNLAQMDNSGSLRIIIHSWPTSSSDFARPETFGLTQNYPNPFNPTTAIRYQLPTSAEVRLEVFDILGRQAAVLVNGRVEAGVHEATFDASHLASGVYLYRMIAVDAQGSSQVFTRKLTLIK